MVWRVIIWKICWAEIIIVSHFRILPARKKYIAVHFEKLRNVVEFLKTFVNIPFLKARSAAESEGQQEFAKFTKESAVNQAQLKKDAEHKEKKKTEVMPIHSCFM